VSTNERVSRTPRAASNPADLHTLHPATAPPTEPGDGWLCGPDMTLLTAMTAAQRHDKRQYQVTQAERGRSLARMLASQKSVKVGLTGGQKRALRKAQPASKTGAAA